MVMERDAVPLGMETARLFPARSVPRREKRHRTQEAPVTDRGLSRRPGGYVSLGERERGESRVIRRVNAVAAM